MMKNTFVLQVITYLKILDTTQTSKKHSQKCLLCRKREITEKIIIVIAVYDRGMSEPLFRTSKTVAVNTSIYINEFIEKRLLPFIHKYHGDFEYLFWPGLVSSHYAKDSLNLWMNVSIMLIRNSTHQMCHEHDQLRTFGDI